MGRQVPPELLRQIQEDKRKEIEEDSFNNFNNKSEEQEESQEPNADLMGYHPHHQQSHYNQPIYQNFIHNNHISKIPAQIQRPPNKFAPQYAAYVGAKPRAQASARVGLGGVF
jgi:hypothetical protein